MEVDNKQNVVLNAADVEKAAKEDENKVNETNEEVPKFKPLTAQEMSGTVQIRRLRCPPNRYTPLKNNWKLITKPIIEQLKLQIRFNTKTKSVEIRTSQYTTDTGALQKAEDFVHAYFLGFEIQDAIALLRLDDLYIESFEIKDVKTLKGDHISRAIGRIAGQNGKTKFAIENATKTRIVLADQKIHILGSYANIAIARDAVCNLIMGAPPGKVYNQMKQVAARQKDRF